MDNPLPACDEALGTPTNMDGGARGDLVGWRGARTRPAIQWCCLPGYVSDGLSLIVLFCPPLYLPENGELIGGQQS